jgi:hypothetical protein
VVESATGKAGGLAPGGIFAVVPLSIVTAPMNDPKSSSGAATLGNADAWTSRRAAARDPHSFFVDFIILQLAFVKTIQSPNSLGL